MNGAGSQRRRLRLSVEAIPCQSSFNISLSELIRMYLLEDSAIDRLIRKLWSNNLLKATLIEISLFIIFTALHHHFWVLIVETTFCSSGDLLFATAYFFTSRRQKTVTFHWLHMVAGPTTDLVIARNFLLHRKIIFLSLEKQNLASWQPEFSSGKHSNLN